MTAKQYLLFFITLLLASVGFSAQAATYEWLPDKDSSWSVPTNWRNSIAPPVGGAPDAILIFDNSAFGSEAINNLPGVFSLNHMTFNNNGSGLLTVESNSGSSLLFTGTNPTISVPGVGLNALENGVALDADLAIDLDLGSLDISSFISGSHGITVTGSEVGYPLGVLTLSGNNTFTGGVTLDSGNLEIDSGLNNPLSTGPLTINGGYLHLDIEIDNPIVLNADFSFLGDSSDVVTINGPITVANSSAGLLAEGGIIWLHTPLDIQGPTVLGRDVNYFPGGGPAFLSLGTGSGSFGTLLQTSSISLLNGSALTINNADFIQGNLSDRVSDIAPITMKTGGILLDAALEGSTETVGPVTVSGFSSITAEPHVGRGQAAILTLSSISRVDHGVLAVHGQKLGVTAESNHGAIFAAAGGPALIGGGGAPGTTTVSIVPWAVGDYEFQNTTAPPNSFATYESANGFRPLNPATEFATSLGSNPLANVLLLSTTTNNVAKTVNSLVMKGDASITLDGTGSVAITSGALLFTGLDTKATVNNSLSFGSAEAIITCGSYNFSTASFTVNGSLSGSGGLTKSGFPSMLLTADNTGLTGPLTLNGYIDITSANSLPGTGTITAYSTAPGPTYAKATSGIAINGSVQINRDIVLASGIVALDTLSDMSAAVFSGTISGPGSLAIDARDSAGSVELTGTNTYTGSTTIYSGPLIIHSDASLGASGGTIEFSAGLDTDAPTLRLAGDWTTSRRIFLSHAATIDTAEHAAVLNGTIHGPGPLTKLGSGTLTLNGPYIFSGTIFDGTTVNAGTLIVNGIHGASITVVAGTLGGHGTILNTVSIGKGGGPGAVLAPAIAGGGPGPINIAEALTLNSDATFIFSFKARGNRVKGNTVTAKGVTISHGAIIQLQGQIQGALPVGMVIPVIVNSGSTATGGTFNNLAEGAIVTVNGNNLQATYKGGSGQNDLLLTVVP